MTGRFGSGNMTTGNGRLPDGDVGAGFDPPDNRPDRYTPLIQHMQLNGCDIELVRRGVEARRLSRALQEDVLRQLRDAPAG